MLLSGRIDAAVLSEPVATVALMRAGQAGAALVRAIDLQAEWGAVTGLGPVVPQAGLAVTQAFSADHGDLIAPLQAAMVAATQAVLADPAAAAERVVAIMRERWHERRNRPRAGRPAAAHSSAARRPRG